MRKKKSMFILAIAICIVITFVYFLSSTHKEDTITSREHIWNSTISKGNKWTIAKELDLDGYIISLEKEYTVHVVYYDDVGNKYE